MKIDPDDLITQTDAARIRGVSHQAIAHLIREGRFQVINIAGKKFLLRSEVENYQPSAGGRPKKQVDKHSLKEARKSRTKANKP